MSRKVGCWLVVIMAGAGLAAIAGCGDDRSRPAATLELPRETAAPPKNGEAAGEHAGASWGAGGVGRLPRLVAVHGC